MQSLKDKAERELEKAIVLLTQLQGDKTSARADVSKLQGDLTAALAANQAEVAALRAELTQLKGTKARAEFLAADANTDLSYLADLAPETDNLDELNAWAERARRVAKKQTQTAIAQSAVGTGAANTAPRPGGVPGVPAPDLTVAYIDETLDPHSMKRDEFDAKATDYLAKLRDKFAKQPVPA